MSGSDIRIKGQDGDFSAYLSKPPSGTGPAIVVIQEIFGVNKVMRDISDALAKEGFITLCPDLFWRIEPGIQITDQTEEEWKKAFELFTSFDVDRGIDDISATIHHARSLDGVEKVGAVGYCLGGLLAYLTATRTDCDASAGYYGVNIHEKLSEADQITSPLMLHIAGKDEFVPPEAQQKVRDGLKDNPLVTIHDYPEQDHAFAREGGAHFDREAAAKANERTLAFFRQHLG
jgi:carboxymethylenebutenolidase